MTSIRSKPCVVRMWTYPSLNDQVAPLDQIDAHLLCQKRMLEVGRVEDARREHRHRRLPPVVAHQRLQRRRSSWLQ